MAPFLAVPAIRLFDMLPVHPIVTLASTVRLLDTSAPTASNAVATLVKARILRERTGKKRDRVYGYLQVLTEDTQ